MSQLETQIQKDIMEAMKAKDATKDLAGLADGKTISSIVKKLLA